MSGGKDRRLAITHTTQEHKSRSTNFSFGPYRLIHSAPRHKLEPEQRPQKTNKKLAGEFTQTNLAADQRRKKIVFVSPSSGSGLGTREHSIARLLWRDKVIIYGSVLIRVVLKKFGKVNF